MTNRPMDTLRRLQQTVTNTSSQPPMKRPAGVMGGLGQVPAAPIDTAKELPEPRRLSPSQAQHLMQAELLSAVRSLVESSTELTARIGRRGGSNGVLEVWAGVFPAATPSVITRTYEVAIGSVAIENLSAAGIVTVQSGVAAGDTGGQVAGVGVQYIRPGSRLIMPVGDRSFTMTGTAADKVSFQAYTGLQPFGVSVL